MATRLFDLLGCWRRSYAPRSLLCSSDERSDLLQRSLATTRPETRPQFSTHFDGDPSRAEAEAAVEVFAKDANTRTIATWNDFLNTGLETVEIVAKIYHPDRKDPMLRFTVPEALTLVEQVSGRLRPVFEGTIPLGNRLTVAQFAQVYRWRGIYDAAGRAWSIWRIARTINPVTAATYEMREKLSNSLFQWVKGTISGRLLRAYIQEVGAASIDLYSGELRKAALERKAGS